MNISPVSGANYDNRKNAVGFRAVYPVYQWVSENGRTYRAVTEFEEAFKLNKKLVRLLNDLVPILNIKNPSEPQKMVNTVAEVDGCYLQTPIVRGAYNKKGKINGNGIEPFSYIASGDDAIFIEQKYGKPIGKFVAEGGTENDGINLAQLSYPRRVLTYIKKRFEEFKEAKGNLGLHVKYDVRRSKKGKPLGYDIVGVRFMAESGAENPFVKLGYTK